MSNICTCPEPPGGSITCGAQQLAMCGYRNGQIVSGCFDRPAALSALIKPNQRLAASNWMLSMIMGVSRSDSDAIEPHLLVMLNSGHYENEETGETIEFSRPSDLDVVLVNQVSVMTR